MHRLPAIFRVVDLTVAVYNAVSGTATNRRAPQRVYHDQLARHEWLQSFPERKWTVSSIHRLSHFAQDGIGFLESRVFGNLSIEFEAQAAIVQIELSGRVVNAHTVEPADIH